MGGMVRWAARIRTGRLGGCRMQVSLFGLIAVLVLLLAATGCAEEAADRTPVGSFTPSELLAEREANATRYDDTYKGKYITITGEVRRIDSGRVTLSSGFLSFGSTVDLRDMPREEQAALDKGQVIYANCKVGNFILGSITLTDCRLQ